MAKVIVMHRMYGCETGCCGHVVLTEGQDEWEGEFEFEHPFREDPRDFAEALVRRTLGDEHVADLDWENCIVEED